MMMMVDGQLYTVRASEHATTEKIKYPESYKAAIHRIVKKRKAVKIAEGGNGKKGRVTV